MLISSNLDKFRRKNLLETLKDVPSNSGKTLIHKFFTPTQQHSKDHNPLHLPFPTWAEHFSAQYSLAEYFWANYFLVEYLTLFNFFASFVPFILAHATARPLSRLMQFWSRPQNKELARRNSRSAEILRPFVGFFVFCVGKLLTTVYGIILYDAALPGFVAKPFTMYGLIGIVMLSPLGLHFFLAYQEFTFHSFCSYYRAFARHVSETSEEELKVARRSPSSRAEQKNAASGYEAPRETLDNVEELIDMMKNMTKTFGPFLLQNFSLMLLHWLLHVYFLCYSVILIAPGNLNLNLN